MCFVSKFHLCVCRLGNFDGEICWKDEVQIFLEGKGTDINLLATDSLFAPEMKTSLLKPTSGLNSCMFVLHVPESEYLNADTSDEFKHHA